jgi:hypothetical protein
MSKIQGIVTEINTNKNDEQYLTIDDIESESSINCYFSKIPDELKDSLNKFVTVRGLDWGSKKLSYFIASSFSIKIGVFKEVPLINKIQWEQNFDWKE